MTITERQETRFALQSSTDQTFQIWHLPTLVAVGALTMAPVASETEDHYSYIYIRDSIASSTDPQSLGNLRESTSLRPSVNIDEALADFALKLGGAQQELDSDSRAILYENRWDLYVA